MRNNDGYIFKYSKLHINNGKVLERLTIKLKKTKNMFLTFVCKVKPKIIENEIDK